ncbi:TIGR03643 family protein [Alphaproteobacteria bacterium]|nr:TIGR03643 family protein [Alphaproteobacteria bacterium]
MAWCDKTSFDSIQDQTGLAEKEVIKIMRSNLKRSSFKVWRERVCGRKAKHEKK